MITASLRRVGPLLLAGLFMAGLLAASACRRDDAPPPGTQVSAPSVVTSAPSPLPSGGASPPVRASAAGAASTEGDLETVDDQPEAEDSTDPSASCAPIDPGLKPMELQRFTFTSGVEKKRPTDRLTAARPGQRVHAHLTLRNRSGVERCVRLVLTVNGQERTTHTFKVGKSWSWRTWGYLTLRPDDRGALEAVVRDDQGAELARQSLPIAVPR